MLAIKAQISLLTGTGVFITMSEASICDIFQDLIITNSHSTETLPPSAEQLKSGDVIPPAPKNAYSMSLTEIIPELERRSLSVKGFYCDDAKTLQIAFDREHESYIESMKKDLLDKQIMEARDQAVKQQQEVMRSSCAEEERLISNNVRIAAWFKSIKDKLSDEVQICYDFSMLRLWDDG
jgi:hypothetical protein